MIASPLIRSSVESCAYRLRARFGSRIRTLRLFGSWARGEAHADSDVDVAVVVEGLTFEEWREAIDLALENEIETGVPLTPFVVSGERFDALRISNRRIANDILTEGVSFE
jgi:hypothetical protein